MKIDISLRKMKLLSVPLVHYLKILTNLACLGWRVLAWQVTCCVGILHWLGRVECCSLF